MDYREFAGKIKSKYPGSYDDMDDMDLARKMVAKYPEYSDISFKDENRNEPSIMNYDVDGMNLPFPVNVTSKLESGVRRLFNRRGEEIAEGLAGPGVTMSSPAKDIEERTGIPSSLFAPAPIMGLPYIKDAKPGEPGLKTSPRTAAYVGTGVSMAPDIATSVPVSLFAKAPGVARAAIPMARRALGFSKRFLNTPFSRGQATKAAEFALEKDVIPMSGNPQTMLSRAQDIMAKSRSAITDKLSKIPAQYDDVMRGLESVRSRLTQGIGKGAKSIYKKVNSVIDEVEDTVTALKNTGPDVSMSNINQIKNRLAGSLDFLADKASQMDNKAIQAQLSNTIRETVKKVFSPAEYQNFIRNQKAFHLSELMERGLNNELAAQMGNKVISPYSAVAATGQMAAGSPGGAAATLGVTEGLMRRGMGTGARGVQEMYRRSPGAAVTGYNVGRRLLEDRDEPRPMFR